MSVLHWALGLPLRSSSKFTLVVLVMLGDDNGVSYPSQSWIARATSRDVKTVRASLADLKRHKLVGWKTRRSNTRGFTSNAYVVLAPPQVMACGSLGNGATTGRAATPRHRGMVGQQQPTDTRYSHQRDITAHGSFVFPNGIAEKDLERIRRALPSDSAVAQQILDELAARMLAGGVRSPVRYAIGLIQRHRAGEFAPDKGLRIAGERIAANATPSTTDLPSRTGEIAAAIAGLAESKVIALHPVSSKNRTQR